MSVLNHSSVAQHVSRVEKVGDLPRLLLPEVRFCCSDRPQTACNAYLCACMHFDLCYILVDVCYLRVDAFCIRFEAFPTRVDLCLTFREFPVITNWIRGRGEGSRKLGQGTRR